MFTCVNAVLLILIKYFQENVIFGSSFTVLPRHVYLYQQEITNELARQGTKLVSETSYPVNGIPLTVVKRKLDNLFLRKALKRWSSISSCIISKTLWPQYNRRRTQKVLRTPHHSIFKLVAVFTGCVIGRSVNTRKCKVRHLTPIVAVVGTFQRRKLLSTFSVNYRVWQLDD